MTGRVIHKMTGSGNDFVVVDGRFGDLAPWSAAQIRAVCDRRRGVGADGFVVVEPGGQPDAVRMTYFNSDGSPAPMCGNAALCATRFAARHELAPASGMRLETGAGAYRTRCLPGAGERAEIELGDISGSREVSVSLQAGERAVRLVTVGVPHLVVVVENVADVAIHARGGSLRHDPAVPGGANVNFVSRDPAGWAMRTYERGVEDETLACGTGAVAVAVVLSHLGAARTPWSVRTASGCHLEVDGSIVGAGMGGVRLVGEGRMVFRGVLGSSSGTIVVPAR